MSTKDIKYWLEEKELKTPKHDEMVLWAFENATKIIKELKMIPEEKMNFFHGNFGVKVNGSWNWEKNTFEGDESNIKEFQETKEEMEKEFESFLELINSRKPCEVDKKIEYALGGNYNIGFIDLAAHFKYERIKTEHFLKNTEDPLDFFFEIKPEIKSIGEVMRQINYYRKFLDPKSRFILITKTKGLKEIFRSQEVYVYEYKMGQQKL